MTLVIRMTTRWDGFLGSPGYTNFYARSGGNPANVGQNLSDALTTFWGTINGLIPAVVDLTILPTWQEFNDLDGQVIDEGVIGTPAAVISGNSGSGFAANSGFLIEWLTGSFYNGHRLKGRSYIVPAIGVFATDGTLDNAVAVNITGACSALIFEDFDLVTWHRPIGGTGGFTSVITSARLSDTAAVLRSRGK